MIPFTRELAGPMDYTPGGFDNSTKAEFVAQQRDPKVLGIRILPEISIVKIRPQNLLYSSANHCCARVPGHTTRTFAAGFAKSNSCSTIPASIVFPSPTSSAMMYRLRTSERTVSATEIWCGCKSIRADNSAR